MLFMVTNRRVINGKFGDEEKPNKKFEYQFAYNGQKRRQDRFEMSGKKGFEVALCGGPQSLNNSDAEISSESFFLKKIKIEKPYHVW